MSRNFDRFGWLAVLAGLIFLAYAIPYLFLSSVERLSGAFLFWTLFGVVAVSLIIYRTARWKV